MPDPADKSDDLIAELAKLMAAPTGKPSAVQPPVKPAPLNLTPISTAPVPAASAPPPVRIPGMDAAPPKPAAPAPATVPATDTRAPATGTIRIPGMDQPAPVSTSAPVGKFDFGKPVATAAIKQEPLSSLSERLAAQNPSPAPAAPRIPSSLTPVSENRSFAEGPALTVARPAPAASAPAGDFSFDFGFAQNPPAAGGPPRPIPQPQPGPPALHAVEAEDPIAALIEADMVDHVEAAEPEPVAETPARPALSAAPMLRAVNGQPSQAKPSIAPANSVSARPVNNAPIPLKPVSVAPRPPESDRFAISPGVGLNMKPPAGQPLGAPMSRAPQPAPAHDDDDPMSEIESLIGEAVRVELTPGPVRVQAPQSVSPKVELEPEEDVEAEIAHHAPPAASPVVPPLTTQFAPRRANLKDDSASRSAEDAILAAAAASGSDVGRMEPSVGGESPYRRLKVKPERSSFFSGGLRQYIGMAVAGTLLLAAGLGLYWVLNMGRSSATGANAPVLTADATPAKVLPSAAPSAPTDVAKSPVLAKMDGASQAPSSELLVSTEQSTADVTNDATPAAGGSDNENGLANRKVRTVTVRPDGTIVSGDDAVAGGEALPIDRPNVPAVPSTETTNLLGNNDQGASPTPLVPSALDATASQTAPPADATTQTADASPVIDTTAVAPTPMQFPVRGSTAAKTGGSLPTNTAVNALVPKTTQQPQQLDLMGNGGGDATTAQKPVQVATTKPVQATPAPTAAAPGGTAAAYVQLSSQPSAADAQANVKSMTAKYGSLFGGSSLTVQQVDLGQKGVRWRVRLPAASLSDATSICAQIKAQGGDCFATNG